MRIVLADFYGQESVVYRQFLGIRYAPTMFYTGQPESDYDKAFHRGLDQADGFLESRIRDLQDHVTTAPVILGSTSDLVSDPKKIFVVHGHDQGRRETVARFLEKLGLEPIVLHEQADNGLTIIEKFEAHASDVNCAVVLLTADDLGSSKAEADKQEVRARQNVILEFGYFVGRLGRKNTFALVEKDVALPSDMHGLVYIPLDDGQWTIRLVRELKAAGLDIDANRAF